MTRPVSLTPIPSRCRGPTVYPPLFPPRPRHHISRRADSACAMVTPSAYSRSPPTGSPARCARPVSRSPRAAAGRTARSPRPRGSGSSRGSLRAPRRRRQPGPTSASTVRSSGPRRRAATAARRARGRRRGTRRPARSLRCRTPARRRRSGRGSRRGSRQIAQTSSSVRLKHRAQVRTRSPRVTSACASRRLWSGGCLSR